MKTNHQRGFKATKPRAKGGTCFNRRGVFADIALYARVGVEQRYDGKQGVARAVRGAKKLINSRFRHHENAATRRWADGVGEAD